MLTDAWRNRYACTLDELNQSSLYIREIMGAWRNWYTRTLQERMEQSLEVQILSRPHRHGVAVNEDF